MLVYVCTFGLFLSLVGVPFKMYFSIIGRVVLGASSVSYELLHNLGANGGLPAAAIVSAFVPRGTLHVSSATVKVSQNPLSDTAVLALQDIVDQGGFYKLSMCPENKQIIDDTCYSTFLKACRLQVSGLKDHLKVHVDSSGHVIGVTQLIESVGHCDNPPPSQNSEFTTTAKVHLPSQAPAPETQAFVQKMEEQKKKKATGQVEDNRSFIAKYWMYIVPVVIFLALSSAQEQPGGGGS